MRSSAVGRARLAGRAGGRALEKSAHLFQSSANGIEEDRRHPGINHSRSYRARKLARTAEITFSLFFLFFFHSIGDEDRREQLARTRGRFSSANRRREMLTLR